MKRILLAWSIAAAFGASTAIAGINQWTPTGPSGGSFSAVRYLGNGVAIAASLRSIYRTTDQGVTWTRVAEIMGGYGSATAQSIAINPADSSQVIVLGFAALYCSSDRGLTWKQVNDVDGVSVNSLQPRAVSFSRTGGIAWLAAGHVIYRSLDRGLTWSPRSGGIPTGSNDYVSQLDTGPAGSSIEYAHVTGAPYSTIDSGLTWTPMITPAYAWSFAISRQVPGTLLLVGAGGPIYRSADFGVTWTTGGTSDIYHAKNDPFVAGRALAIANDATFRRTDNDGVTWTARSIIPIGSALDFDFDPADTQRLMLVSNATVIASSDGGASWVERVDGIPEATIARFVVGRGAASALYAPTYGVHRAYRRDPASGTWNAIPELPSNVFGNLYGSSALAVSPVDGNTIYMVANGFFGRSINGGTTWTLVGAARDDITSLVWDPANELTAYAISANLGLLKTIDGGAHWAPSSTGLPRIQSVVVDPSNSSNLYATSDFGYAGTVAVYRSTDAGVSWAPSANGITPTFGWTLAFQPGNSSVLYAGTQGGLYKTVNAGASWTQVSGNSGISSSVFGISIDPQNTDILYVMDTAYPSASSRSVDGGATWESLRMPDLGTNNNPIYLTLVPGRTSLLAGAVYNGGIYEMEIAPDLELTTSATGALAIGIPRTLLLRAHNLGSFAATSGRLSVSLPEAAAGYTVIDNGNSCVLAARQLTCTPGIIRAGSSAEISIAFTPVTAGEELNAQLSAYEPDKAPANNSVVLATERRADVRIALASNFTDRLTGERIEYTLSATNDGPSAAASIVATLQLPANVTYVSATATGLTCARNAQTVTCEAGSLAANASAGAVVTVEAAVAGAAAASVSVASAGTDPLMANNSASNTVTVTAPPPPAPAPAPTPTPTPTPTPATPRSGGGGGGGSLDYLLLAMLAGLATRGSVRRH